MVSLLEQTGDYSAMPGQMASADNEEFYGQAGGTAATDIAAV